jgi:hypothetical protein
MVRDGRAAKIAGCGDEGSASCESCCRVSDRTGLQKKDELESICLAMGVRPFLPNQVSMKVIPKYE